MYNIRKLINNLAGLFISNGLNSQKYPEYLLEVRPKATMSDAEFESFAPWSDRVQECCVNRSKAD